MTKKKRDEKTRRRDLDNAVTEIGNIRNSLNDAYTHFNNTTDPDALDACIFEISALRSRYNTALKHYRDRYY
ncbi:MAG: DUF2508 family protein [Clostridiales bacterium]|mgnify:CR=1 FL=1|nr:DUF2508 family protein [Clostridiales bacterium]